MPVATFDRVRMHMGNPADGPNSPSPGDLFLDTNGNRLYFFDGDRVMRPITTGIAGVSGLTTDATAGNLTITAAMIATGLIRRDHNGGARTDTTDTAANIIAACGLVNNGDFARCYYVNTADAAEAVTFAGGTGVTISNVGQTVAQNESVELVFRRTSATAVSMDIIGA